jgi:hypothetical protein
MNENLRQDNLSGIAFYTQTNMKTLLVPVDFTATSENAVNFAIEWCRTYEYERIILLKTFYDSIFEGLIVSAEYSNVTRSI